MLNTLSFRNSMTPAARYFLLALVLFAAQAFAGAVGLPWETPMGLVSKSLTGPVALGGGLIGLVVIGVGNMIRPDVFEFGSKAVMIPLILAILLGASGLITTLFPALVGAVV